MVMYTLKMAEAEPDEAEQWVQLHNQYMAELDSGFELERFPKLARPA